jgi:hypothetical protein
MSTWVIYAEPFKTAEGGFTWHATKEVVEWLRNNDPGSHYYGDDGDIQLPLEVCLYNAAGRGDTPGKLHHLDDEDMAMLGTCRAAGDRSWIVCSTSPDGEVGRLALTAKRRPRKRSEQ